MQGKTQELALNKFLLAAVWHHKWHSFTICYI